MLFFLLEYFNIYITLFFGLKKGCREMLLKIILILVSSVTFLFIATMIRCIKNSIKTIKEGDGGRDFFRDPVNCVGYSNLTGGPVTKTFLCWHGFVGQSGRCQSFDNSIVISFLTTAVIFLLGVVSIAISHTVFDHKWFLIRDMFIASLTFFCMSMSLFYYAIFGKKYIHDVLMVRDNCCFFGIFFLVFSTLSILILISIYRGVG